MSHADTRHRVLLAAESRDHRLLVYGILEQADYAVDEAADGGTAVQAAAARRYDLILMDLALSGVDGVEATRRIRRLLHPRGDVPILGMTGTAGAADKDRCFAAGMDGFLVKPIDRLELLEAVAHWVAAVDDPTWGLEPRPGLSPPLVNRRTLTQLEDDVGELLPEILLTFLQETDRRWRLLEERVSGGDAAGAADQAHALKGSAGTFGAMALRQCVYDLEQLGRAGEVARLAARLPEVRRLMAATWDLLRAQYPFLMP